MFGNRGTAIVDYVMIGRGIFGNPWVFNRERDYKTISVEEKLHVMVGHTKLFEKLLGEHKSFMIMKKHYKAYVNGFEGARELRLKLMEEAENAEVVEKIVQEFLRK
jgi:tRNA-dihydrouridine synthase